MVPRLHNGYDASAFDVFLDKYEKFTFKKIPYTLLNFTILTKFVLTFHATCIITECSVYSLQYIWILVFEIQYKAIKTLVITWVLGNCILFNIQPFLGVQHICQVWTNICF